MPAAPKCTAFAEEVRALAARITKGVAPLVAKAARTLARRRAALAEAEAERAAAVAAAAAAAAFDRAVAEEADPAAAAPRLLPPPADLLAAVPTRGDVVVGKLKRSASAAVIASALDGVTLKPVDDEWDGTTLPLFHDIPGDSTFDALAQFQRRNKKSKRPKSAPSLRGCFGAAQRPNAVNLHQYQAGGGADEEVKKTSQQPAIKEAVKEELSKGKVSCVIS